MPPERIQYFQPAIAMEGKSRLQEAALDYACQCTGFMVLGDNEEDADRYRAKLIADYPYGKYAEGAKKYKEFMETPDGKEIIEHYKRLKAK